jgi:hypothetical protein
MEAVLLWKFRESRGDREKEAALVRLLCQYSVIFLPQVLFTNWWSPNQPEVASFDGQNLNARVVFIGGQRE